MKKIFTLMLLVFCIFSATVYARGVTYTTNNDATIVTVKDAGVTITIKNMEKEYIFEIESASPGWTALGFGQTKFMKNGEIILIYENNGTGQIRHDYGVGFFAHKPINKLDSSYPKEKLRLLSYKKENSKIYAVISRAKDLKGKYYKDLKSGEKINFMCAVSNSDNLGRKHKTARSGEIILP